MEIVVVFGGASVEHGVSVLTGLHASGNIMEGHRVHLVYLDSRNRFLIGKAISDIDYYVKNAGKKTVRLGRGVRECFFHNGALYKKGCFVVKKVCKVDVVLNCCHGGIGENGELAAMLNVAGIPITSCDYLSAGKLMSKSLTREILMGAGYDQPKFVKVIYKDWKNREKTIDKIVKKVGFPLIVKPDTLGSSIGINVARNEEELTLGLEVAFGLDKVCIIEEFIDNALEVNCAAFFAKDKVWLSKCEVMDKSEGDILDYDKKYIDGGEFIGKGKGVNVKRDNEPEEYADIFKQVQKITESAYKLFGANGIVRADFLVSQSKNRADDISEFKVFLNEINTVPGFLSYHLWLKDGIPYGALIDMVIAQVIAQKENKMELITEYKSDVLIKNRSLVER